MVYETVQSSPKATHDGRLTSKYPFRTMNVGTSFTVPYNDVRETTLRSLCSRHGKKLEKKFRLVRHDDRQIYEIARIA